MKRTKLLHSRPGIPGETEPLVVVDPKEILIIDRVRSSSLQEK
jgi:hypothetical protein